MTKLLERVFAEAGKLPAAEQDVLASRLLAELGEEDEFDRAIAASADKLAATGQRGTCGTSAGQHEESTPIGYEVRRRLPPIIGRCGPARCGSGGCRF